jgi:predicted ATP-grasp superfamily ATP-dependent carboligase
MPMRVLLAGVSTRAAAESAARAGFDVVAIDRFADLDQHPRVHAVATAIPFGTRSVCNAARGLPRDAVAYLSNLDNHPDAVRRLAAGTALWGNSPGVLQRVRNPREVRAALSNRGLPSPRLDAVVDGVLKPFASGGGRRVRRWKPGMRIPARCYVQEYIAGTPASIVFIANGRDAAVFGLTRQLIGRASFGVAGFRYCGNVMLHADEVLMHQAQTIARALTEAFGLIGSNGVDAIIREHVIYPIEVNPRWTASMELFERATGMSMFAAHAEACSTGQLSPMRSTPADAVLGKAILFARRQIEVDPTPWLDDPAVRDIPHPGARIRAGEPICTVFGAGVDEASCIGALERKAGSLYDEIETSQPVAVA